MTRLTAIIGSKLALRPTRSFTVLPRRAFNVTSSAIVETEYKIIWVPITDPTI
jgi:hypothetical protein